MSNVTNDSAWALYILVHPFAILCKSATWNDQFWVFNQNMYMYMSLVYIESVHFLFLSETEQCLCEFIFRIAQQYYTKLMRQNDHKVVVYVIAFH